MTTSAGDLDPNRAWNARAFFAALAGLGPLRVISQCGPSTFEALCTFDAHDYARGFMNAMTDAYHWHVRVDGVGFVQSFDDVHKASGRRVLHLSLHEREGERPFLLIYLFRAKGAEFDPTAEARFAELHRDWSAGVELVREEAS